MKNYLKRIKIGWLIASAISILLVTTSINTVSTAFLYGNSTVNPNTVYYDNGSNNDLSYIYYNNSVVWSKHIYNIGQSWTYGYSGCAQMLTIADAGTYKVEIYGAKGGDCNGSGAYGGYTVHGGGGGSGYLGGVTSGSTSSGANSGNGVCRVTLLSYAA